MDFARLNLQIDYRAIAHIGPAARQAVGIVAVPFEVPAPGLAPECPCDGPSLDGDRRGGMPFLAALFHLAHPLPAPLGNRNIGLPSVVVERHSNQVSFSALLISSATSLSNSSSLSSVSIKSAPPSSNSCDSWRLDSISSSIFSST